MYMKQKLLLVLLFFCALTYAQKQSGGLNAVSGNNHLFTPVRPVSTPAVNANRPAPFTNVGLPMACVVGSQYPTTTWPASTTGNQELITGSAWPGEYAVVSVSIGYAYTFNTSVDTDYITITTTTGTVLAEGTGTVVWNNTNVTGNIRYFIHLNANCGTSSESRNRYISASVAACTPPTGITVNNVGPHTAGFTWNAVQGTQVLGYQMVYTSSLGVVPDESYPVTITTTVNSASDAVYTESTTYYHFIRTICTNGNSDWVPFQFTTTPAIGCTTFSYPQWPATFTPSCTGVSQNIATDCYAGEYSMVVASAARRYTFNSSVTTDMITVTDATGSTIYATGYSPLVWNSGTISGNIRFYTHLTNCGSENVNRTRSITCDAVSCSAPSGFTFSNITTTSGSVTWNVGTTSPTAYQIEYGTSALPKPYDNLSTEGNLITSLGVNLTDLANNTTYHIYVRAICDDIPGPWIYAGNFTTTAVGCTTAQNGLYPGETYTPTCTGINETITTSAWAGEYTNVNVTANRLYTFSSSDTGDFITITNATGTTVLASGATPLDWTATSTATIRYLLHANSNCDAENVSRNRYIKCSGCTSPAPTASALSFCGSATVANLTATGTNLKWYIDNTSTTVLNTTTTIFTRTYYVSQTINGCESPRVAVPVTVNNSVAPPTAPDFNLCNGATVANLTATGTNIKWYSTLTGGSPLASTVVLTGGTYFVSQTVNGCESARNAISVSISSTAPPAASAQTMCGSNTVSNILATGTNLKWYLASTGGTSLSTSTQVATRTYYVSQTVNGCESSRTPVAITVNTVAPPTATDITLCNGATVANLVATGTNIKWYNVDFGGTPLTPASQLYTGYFFATQTINGCESSRTVVYVTITTPSAPVVEFTDTSCTGNTGSINIVSPRGTGITYSINGGNSYQSSPLFSNLAIGSYIILYKNATGCTSEIYQGGIYTSAPVAPIVTTVQPTCAVAAGTITVTAPTGTGLTYSINGGAYQASATFTNLVAGTYAVRVKNAAGCTSPVTSVTINAAPATPTAPVVAFTGTSCVGNTGTITVMSPLGTGITYSINGGNSYQASNSFANLAAGSYIVYYKTAAGCRSAAFIADVYTASAPAAPTVTAVQPSCFTSATGTITITNDVQGLTYSIDGTTYQIFNTFTNLNPGTYTVTTKNGAGCISASTLVTIDPMLDTPSVPVVQFTAPSCTSNSGTITVTSPVGAGFSYSIDGSTYYTSPIFRNLAAGSYRVIYKTITGCNSNALVVNIFAPSAPAAPTVTAVQPTCAVTRGTITVTAPTGTGLTYSINGTTYVATATFTNVAPGTYSVTAKNAAGCVSAATSVTVNTAPATPATPTVTSVQPTCAVATGTITVTAPTGTGLTYSINGQTYQASATFTNVAVGTYSVTAKNAAGCTSTATSVTINAAPATPVAPTVTSVQPTCAVAMGTITVTAPTGTGITYSINGQTYQASATFTNLAAGTYSVTAKNAAGCVSAATSVTINAAPATPTAPVVTSVQPTCAVATGTITVTAPTGTGITYSINGTAYQASATFTNLAAGTYSVTAKNAAGCTSTATSVTINAAPATPAAPTVTSVQPTCAVATGTITVTAPTGTGITYSINGQTYQASATFTNLAAGTYAVTAKNAAGCTSTATSVTINAAPATPAAPTVTSVQPTCAVATGTITVTAPTGTGITYSINGTTYVASATFANLAAGTYPVTTKNAAGCVSAATSVTINAAPATPTAPVVTSVQPTCAVATGTITVTAPTGTGITYSINGQTYQASATFANLAAGTYSVTAKSAGGCVSSATSVTINEATALAMPIVALVQPTCSVGTGTITVSNAAAGLEYSLNQISYQASATFTNVTPGTYSVTVRNAEGCTASTFVTINLAPATPTDPVVATVQPTCSFVTGTITVTSPVGVGLTYSITGENYQASNIFTNLAPGTYSVTAKNTEGCISVATIVIINAVPNAPGIPTTTVTQPTCSVATGTVSVNNPVTGQEYSFNGGNYQTSTTFANVAPGTYTINARNATGCITSNTVTVDAPAVPNGPVASAQTFCTAATVAQLTANGTGLKWYADATTTTPLASTAVLSTGVYYVSQTVNSCESTRTSVNVTVNNLPVIAPVPNVTACSSYTLPALALGNYYSMPGGGGVTIPAGTVLTTTQQLYLYAINDCGMQEEAFMVTIIPTPVIAPVSDVLTCQSYTLPQLATGNYYTEAAGMGSMIPAGTVITQNMVIYIFATSGTVPACTSERSFTVAIQPTTPVTAEAQIFCGSATVANLVANGDNLQWYASADATTPLAASTPLETAVYFVSQTVNGCESTRTWVDVVVNTTSLPTAEATQVISAETAPDATIEDIIIEGSNIQWYASPEAVTAGTPLAQGTELVNGATYYATQTVNGCESAFLAVTVEVVLNTDVKQGIKFTYYPNPVKDRLHIISGTTISLVEVYNLQGQKVISQSWNVATGELNMVQLEEANYLVRVYTENNTQSFMVSKGH
jgi:hypothetical protein